MKSKYMYGVMFCLAATLSWGVMFPVMTSALRKIDPFTFTALRYTIAGIAFLALLVVREGRSALSLKGERVLLAWFLGTCGFAGFGFLAFWGQQLIGKTGALSASIMMATMPLLGLLVNWAVRKVRPPAFSFLFIALSFSGVVLVITKGNISSLISSPQHYSAYGLLILGALSWVIYTVGASLFPTWSAYRYTAITAVLGLTSMYTIDAGLLLSHYIPVPSVATVTAILPQLAYMAIVAGFLGVLSWNMGNKIITTLNGVLFMDVVPLTAFSVSAVLGVVPERAQIAGASLTAVALVLNNLYLRRVMARQAVKTDPIDTSVVTR